MVTAAPPRTQRIKTASFLLPTSSQRRACAWLSGVVELAVLLQRSRAVRSCYAQQNSPSRGIIGTLVLLLSLSFSTAAYSSSGHIMSPRDFGQHQRTMRTVRQQSEQQSEQQADSKIALHHKVRHEASSKEVRKLRFTHANACMHAC